MTSGAVVPAIRVAGLTKDYGTGVRAVDDVTLTVPAGQIFAFLGPNGAGKTTTIKMLAGLLTPTAGRAELNGHDVARDRSAAMEQFGAVLEGSRNVYWSLSAWQNLIYFGRLKGQPDRVIKQRAERLLTDLGLWDRRHEKVGGYSRGMQQKVAVATALIADPAIVLLDEPTVGLDVEATRTVKDWVAKLAADQNKTILLTTHQMDVVEQLCDRVAVIRDGKVITDLPTDELLARFRQRERYEIRLEGVVSGLDLPGDFTVEPSATSVEGNGSVTVVRGRVTDPAELYRVLDVLRARGVVVEAMNQVQPSLEDVFLDLVNAGMA